MSANKIGIFPGSFNPVHIGHLALANYLCEFEELDEIWFLVTPQNPLKEQAAEYTDKQRLQWLEKACERYPKFKVSDFEWHLPRPHYTIQTLEALKTAYPKLHFTLIIGADNWTIFDRWKDHEKLLAQFPLIVYPRKDYPLVETSPHPAVRFSQAPLIEISSTFIRESIRAGKDIRFFVPENIYEELIKERNNQR